jgi:toxin secretion/phage lysis holin
VGKNSLKKEDKMKSIINFITGTVLTGVLYLLGGWDIALQTLLIVITIDYVSGVCKAIYNKKLNSKVGIKGIVKKFAYLLTVALAVELDTIMGGTGAIRTLVIYFFVANDGISILENLGGMGIPLPNKLKEVLEQLRDDNNPKKG